ncbi:MAG: WD40 repeat domain-containing protein [Chthonomonadales bacterium]
MRSIFPFALFGLLSTSVFASPSPGLRVAPMAAACSVAFSPDSTKLAVGGESRATIYSASTGKKLAEFGGFPGRITGVQFSPDGKLLALGGGEPGKSGTVLTYNVAWVKDIGLTAVKQMPRKMTGPSDVLYAISWSPDGKRIAASCYDHDVYLWNTGNDVTSDSKPTVLKDHTDAVYGVAFAPDSRHLASVGADRTLKVWDTVTRKRLYTLTESTGELFSVAFRPDGLQMAAVGGDKTVRVWKVTPAGARLAKSAFAHQASILKVVYSHDGVSLLTSSEDLSVKRWNSTSLEEEKVYPKQLDWPYGLAISDNGKLIACATQNGSVDVYDIASGKHVSQPAMGIKSASSGKLPTTSRIPGLRLGDNRQRRPPGNGGATLFEAVLSNVSPMAAERGKTLMMTFSGARIGDANRVVFDDPRISGKITMTKDTNPNVVWATVDIQPTARIGVHRCYVQSSHGTTGSVPFVVGNLPELASNNANKSLGAAQSIAWPCTVVGTLNTPGDVNHYRFACKEGDEVVFDVVGQQLRSRLQPVIAITDLSGKQLTESKTRIGKSDVTLGFKAPRSGEYVLTVRDNEGSGGGDVFYRINVGRFPYVTDFFPLGVQRGVTSTVHVQGFNLPSSTLTVAVPKNHYEGTIGLPIPDLYSNGILNRVLEVSDHRQVLRSPGNESVAAAQPVPAPCAIEGILNGRPGAGLSHYYRFTARRGERLFVDVNARRLGSPLDSEIEILDKSGRPVEMAVARAVGQTEVVLNDRDSATNALRIFSWDDFHINDYLMVGREIVRINEMPKGPDSDIFFKTFRGQRETYFGTTPEYHSLGQAVYKVEMHPAGSSFSPSGYPLTRLYYKNDDGGPVYGKDSHLEFHAPSDGEYIVKISDARGQSGKDYAYRLLIHSPLPHFNLVMNPEHPNIPHGGSVVVNIECERFDGYNSHIDLEFEGLPKGITATKTVIEAGENSASILLTATPEVPPGPANTGKPLDLIGFGDLGTPKGDSFTIVEYRSSGENKIRLLTVLPDPDIRVATDVREVVVHPGEISTLTVEVDRQGKFGARVPIDVKNLPFGVRVDDVGLNGVLVTVEESTREFRLYCQPFVKPQTRLIYVVANVEGGTPNAALPVLLKVEPNARVKAFGAKTVAVQHK